MSNITVTDKNKLEFITDLLQINRINPFKIKHFDDGLIVENNALAKLIERYSQGKPTTLPLWCNAKKSVFWIVWGVDKRELLKTVDELRQFLTPVWAEMYFNEEELPGLPSGYADIFPFGLRLFRSPFSLVDKALSLLEQWADLSEMRPVVAVDEGKVNVYMLRSQFQDAIALQNWDEATRLLEIIRQGHYLSDENHLFLHIQLLSSQQRWTELWNDNNYGLASGLDPIPAKVRNALLTAFYISVLAPYRGDLNAALVVYSTHRYRLGALIRYRAGVDESLPLLVFAYEAAWNRDTKKMDALVQLIIAEEHLEIVQKLRLVTSEGQVSEKILEVEQNRLISETDSLKLAKIAFGEGLYDEAYLHILDCEPGFERVRLMLRLAKITEDVHICAQVRDEYTILVDADKNKMMSLTVDQNSVKWVLGYQENVNDNQEPIRLPINWLEWCADISRKENLHYLIDHFNDIEQREDLLPTVRQEWLELQSILESLVLDDQLDALQRQLLKRSLPRFANNIVLSDDFPNILHQDLYEYLLYGLRTYCSVNGNSLGFQLRIIEGMLRLEPALAPKLCKEMYNGLQITPSLQLSPDILAFIEMFYDYGVTAGTTTAIWNEWMGYLALHFPTDRCSEIESWLYYGKCINADGYLLEQLSSKIQREVIVDPLMKLGKQKIVIFSLREQAAKRAAKRIKDRNSMLDIVVCIDNSLTVRAKQYASNADIPIIVTACLSHALFYGVMPHVKNVPLYPRDAGETGIIQVLEDHALKVGKVKEAS